MRSHSDEISVTEVERIAEPLNEYLSK